MIGVAILGFGVVGSGVYETLKTNRGQIARRSMDELELKYILDLRGFAGEEFEPLVTDDFSLIESDESVRVVVETIGGVGAAYDYTKRAILAGKHVVTSNKELVARHGSELIALAEERGVNYMFEAAVGGGAPIIRPLIQCMSANIIEEIYGILNGTTNFVLTRMFRDGAELSDAIAEAQRRGYAERDPSADVEGLDAARKICILSNLACGADIGVESVACEGIMGVQPEDVRLADRAGYKIKLIARYLRLGGRECCAYVAPHLLSKDTALAGVDGVLGGVAVRGNIVGEVDFIGAGAGKLPTASAVVADVIDAARHIDKTKNRGLWSPSGVKNLPPESLGGKLYVRAAGTISDATAAFGDVLPVARGGEETAFVTQNLTAKEISRGIARLGGSVRRAYRVLESEGRR